MSYECFDMLPKNKASHVHCTANNLFISGSITGTLRAMDPVMAHKSVPFVNFMDDMEHELGTRCGASYEHDTPCQCTAHNLF
jgi:hypothetical protein